MNGFISFNRALCVFAVVACAVVVGPALSWSQERQNPDISGDEVVSDDVSPALTKRARALAERGEFALKAVEAGRLVFVGVEKIRRKNEEGSSEVLYLTTHYGYAENVTIFTTVDLNADRVVAVEEAHNVLTTFSQEEVDEARELALADAAVLEVLGDRVKRVTVQALGLFSMDPEDPIYGHRVVHLFFKEGNRYLVNVEVMVDLTEGTVTVSRTDQQDVEFKR